MLGNLRKLHIGNCFVENIREKINFDGNNLEEIEVNAVYDDIPTT